MKRILPFLSLFVILIPFCGAEETYEPPHARLSFGSDLHWMSKGVFPWGQAVVFTGDLAGYIPTPWSFGLGLGLASGLSTSGYTGTSLIYRSTLNLTVLPQVYWDFYQRGALKLRLSAGPSFSTWLFHTEKSYTFSQGLKAEVQAAWRDPLTEKVLVFSLPWSTHLLVDGTMQYSLGLRAGFQLGGGRGK